MVQSYVLRNPLLCSQQIGMAGLLLSYLYTHGSLLQSQRTMQLGSFSYHNEHSQSLIVLSTDSCNWLVIFEKQFHNTPGQKTLPKCKYNSIRISVFKCSLHIIHALYYSGEQCRMRNSQEADISRAKHLLTYSTATQDLINIQNTTVVKRANRYLTHG